MILSKFETKNLKKLGRDRNLIEHKNRFLDLIIFRSNQK